MRCMIKAVIPHHPSNQLIIEGRFESLVQSMMGDLQPEAAYFTAEEGLRTAYLFVDVPDASKIPFMAEPFFLALDAKVTMTPCMNAEDLGRAGADMKAAAQKYAPNRQFAGAR